MYISQINNNDIGFGGKVVVKKQKKWPGKILNEIKTSQHIKNLSKENDVVVRLNRTLADYYDVRYWDYTPLFKVKISLLKENSIIDKVKDFFGIIPRISITQNYHSDKDLIKRLDSAHFEKFQDRIK